MENKKLEEECNDTWDCYICGNDYIFDNVAVGWLKDIKPLCKCCADKVLSMPNHPYRKYLSYHEDVGVIQSSAAILCSRSRVSAINPPN